MTRASRRRFVQGVGAAGLALAAGCGRLPWQAPSPARVARVAFLGAGVGAEANVAAREQGLRELGWVEGQNLLIERRPAEGQVEQLPGLAAESEG